MSDAAGRNPLTSTMRSRRRGRVDAHPAVGAELGEHCVGDRLAGCVVQVRRVRDSRVAGNTVMNPARLRFDCRHVQDGARGAERDGAPASNLHLGDRSRRPGAARLNGVEQACRLNGHEIAGSDGGGGGGAGGCVGGVSGRQLADCACRRTAACRGRRSTRSARPWSTPRRAPPRPGRVSPKVTCRTSAAAPATCGAAIDVPLIIAAPTSLPTDRPRGCRRPARTSRCTARSSRTRVVVVRSDAATVIAPGTRAGLWSHDSSASLPAATTTVMPSVMSAPTAASIAADGAAISELMLATAGAPST